MTKKSKVNRFEFWEIGILSALSILLLIGITVGAIMLSDNSNYSITEKKNNPLDKIINKNLNDIPYRTVVSNEVYCPHKIGEDLDRDSIDNFCGNCPLHYNPEQFDNDKDGIGNDCDSTPNGVSSSDGDEEEPIPVSCKTNADCGADGFIGNLFCSSNNVAQTFKLFTCNNAGTTQSSCTSRTEDRLIQVCLNGCSNGQCLIIPSPAPKQCDDGIDNDGDNLIDYPADPGCDNRLDDNEFNQIPQPPQPNPQCDDGIDNDGDGLIDYPADPACANRADNSEFPLNQQTPQCDDGIDNDHDGRIDYPSDVQCTSRTDNSE